MWCFYGCMAKLQTDITQATLDHWEAVRSKYAPAIAAFGNLQEFTDSFTCSKTCPYPLSHYMHITDDYLSKIKLCLYFVKEQIFLPTIGRLLYLVITIYEELLRRFQDIKIYVVYHYIAIFFKFLKRRSKMTCVVT